MKKFISYIITLFVIWNVSAQLQDRNSALDKYYKTQYGNSIKELLKIEQKGLGDFETKVILADAYFHLRDFSHALEWMDKASKINHFSEKYNITYAYLLKSNGRYREADSIYKRLGVKYQDQLSDKIKLISPSNYDVSNVEMLNTVSDEFAPAFYRDGIVFTGQPKKKNDLYTWNNKSWLRPFYLPYKPEGTENGQPQLFKLPRKSKKNHQGPVSFGRNSKMIYYSQNQKTKKNEASTLGIYTAHKSGQKWKKVKAFELNHPEYSIAHPSVSKDGRTLFFVSDMPGGMGGTDIYYTKFMNGKWSKPVNLGAAINTSFNEMFPYLHEDGTLYFASDGLPGWGGLDIFYTRFENGAWTIPVNMGKDINSSFDDFGLILDNNKYIGYLSSNRPGGKGGDDIYRVQIKGYRELVKKSFISGKIIDDIASQPVLDAIVNLIANGRTLQNINTQSDGMFRFDWPGKADSVIIQANAEGYFSTEQVIYLSDNKLQDLQIQLQKIELNKSILIHNIYYGFDKWDLSPAAKSELQKLVVMMKKNSNRIIEIGSHTDSRATADYNLELSKKRANEVVNYLIQNGISSERLLAKGYGESEILNRCVDGVDCSEQEHAVNRRTVFKLIGLLNNTTESKQLTPDDMEKVSPKEVKKEKNSELVTPILPTNTNTQKAGDLVYKIQLGVFGKVDSSWIEHFKKYGQVEIQQVPGQYVYRVYLSPFNTYRAANIVLKAVRETEVKEAFIVAFYKGEIISVEKAKDLEK
ncbi:MAG: OmpA family protein [Chitinophagales bacterium]|nr:OmpA family protein [Chitinophagales bacterium]